MNERLQSPRLIIATHNAGKLHEFGDMLHGIVEVVSAGDLGLPEPDETGTTFHENALLKAQAAAVAAKCPALADDSGLCVTALDGRPGLFSGRYAEINGKRDFPAAMKKLHDEIGTNPDRSASFVSVLALAWPDGRHEFFDGRVKGTIHYPPRGTHGHGYDSVFVPDGEARSFAEMTETEKSTMSHRGRAVRQLLEWLGQTRQQP